MSKNVVFDSIVTGLNQAIAYERGEQTEEVKTNIVHIAPLPQYKSNEIKKIRNKLKLSQSLFANALGVSKKTVEAWEAGKNIPNGPAQRILDLLNNENNFLEEHEIVLVK